MDDYESLSHTKWDCKYHVVFIPKYRRKVLYGEPHAGSRPHDDLDPTEIRGFAGGRFYQGQECDPLGADVRGEEAQLCGPELLAQRVFPLDLRSNQTAHTRVH